MDDLTPTGAAAVRLAQQVVQLRAERDRARGIAVALEGQIADLLASCPGGCDGLGCSGWDHLPIAREPYGWADQ